MSNNELTSITDNQLTYLESIETLNLSYNSIDTIEPFTFNDLSTLRTIDLSHNHLASDAFVSNIDSLQLLDLSANRYQSINVTMFANISDVKLIGNTWSCAWIVLELVNASDNVRQDIRFGNDLAGIDGEAMGIRQPEEVICYDDLVQRHLVIVYPKGECNGTKVRQRVWFDEKK